MNVRRLALAALPVSLFVVYACSSDSDGTNASVNLDAGPTTGIGTDTGVPVGDSSSPTTDDSGSPGVDAGPPKGPIITCTPKQALTTDTHTLAGMVTASYQGKYLVTWGEQGAGTTDGQPHLFGRYFDGNALGSPLDLGVDAQERHFATVDGTGKAFIAHQNGSSMARVVFDLTTGTKLPEDLRPIYSIDDNYGIGGLPQGALSVWGNRPPATAYISRYEDGGWDDELDGGDAGYPVSYPTSNISDMAGVALNGTGKGIVWFSVGTGSGGYDAEVHIVPWDGTKLGTPTLRTFPSTLGMSATALSNGDAVFVWLESNASGASGRLAIFHQATQQFDADVVLFMANDINGTGSPVVLADANDNITALYNPPTGYAALRRVNGVWGSPMLVGAQTRSAVAALDPAGDVVVAGFTDTGTTVTRLSPTGTSFDKPVDAQIGGNASQPTPIAFNAAGDPVFFNWTGSGGIFMTTCSSQ